MREEVEINFDGRDIPGGVEAMLAEVGLGPKEAIIEHVEVLRRLDVTITLLETDERAHQLLERLKRLGMLYTVGHHDRYTDEELDNARLLFMRPNWQCEVDGGMQFGTTYDLSSGCPRCGAGAPQTSALFLDGDDDELPKLKGHRAGATYMHHVFVDERLAAELDEPAPTGLLFHNVYALMPDKRQVKLRWKQISADRTLPRMLPTTTGFALHDSCGLCGRNGHIQRGRARIEYRASDLEGAGDVNLTWEGHGRGNLKGEPWERDVSVPWLLVTPKVMRVFRAAGVTEFDWLPIRLVDE